MTQNVQPLALVIGATGGVGGAVAARLLATGWRVRALNRNPQAAGRKPELAGIEWITGDAMLAEDVAQTAEGAQLIVHGANPPGYRNWAGLAVPMLANTIAAAKAQGARILFPGTLYNFGPDAFPTLREDSPQRPTTGKGRVRVQMEEALAKAATEGARVLIVRAGDFFGPGAGNSWFSQAIVKPGRPIRAVSYPGPTDLAHSWAYLPDLAQLMVALAARDTELADFEVFHFRGHELTGVELAAGLERAAGRRLARRTMPWLALTAASPFSESLREILEVRYLWRCPVLLDNSRLKALLGAEPHTPVDQALASTLRSMDALPPDTTARAG